MAETATDDELHADIAVPAQAVARPARDKPSAAAPALLYQELTLAQRVLRDFVNDEPRAS